MSTSTDQHGSNTTRRPRPVISCLECRRKKLKCDRTHPCQQCVKIGRPTRCQYQIGSEPEQHAAYSPGTTTKRPRTTSPANGNEPEPQAKLGIIEDLQTRVLKLEKALLAQHPRQGSLSDPCNSPSDHLSNEIQLDADGPSLTGGQSDPSFPEACDFILSLKNEKSDIDVVTLRDDLRNVHLTVEANTEKRLIQPEPDPLIISLPLDLPPLHICERLAVLYFDNLEHCFRILHWPEFKRQLEILFKDGPEACGFAFLPQLVGALAMGVILGTHEECKAASTYSLTQHGRAVKFMDDFLAQLRGSQKYHFSVLQVRMLTLICRWLGSDPLVDLFLLSGRIVRDALVMRMNQDPATLHGVSVYEGELRRRSWMTIVECDLMLSILCKLPCLVPPYTCRPPRNINDHEIYEGLEFLPESRPTEEWTDGLCQYVLAGSFPRRLAACKQIEGASHVKFKDILGYTSYLEKELSELPPPMRFTYIGDEASKTPPRLMARMELDISIRRPLMHLYSSFASAPNACDIQQEARAGYLQSCLMLTTYQDLFDPHFSELNVPRPQGYWDFFYNVYRHELGQAILGLCLEIKRLGLVNQSHTQASSVHSATNGRTNDTPNRPVYTKANLIHAVKDTLEPMMRRLTRPQAKFKDLVYLNIVFSSVLPEQGGSTRDNSIKQALRKLIQDCRVQLERDRIPLVQSPAINMNTVSSLDGGGPTIPANFDPFWLGFPDIDFSEPLDT